MVRKDSLIFSYIAIKGEVAADSSSDFCATSIDPSAFISVFTYLKINDWIDANVKIVCLCSYEISVEDRIPYKIFPFFILLLSSNKCIFFLWAVLWTL